MEFVVKSRKEYDTTWLSKYRSPSFHCMLKIDGETIARCDVHLEKNWLCTKLCLVAAFSGLFQTDYYYITDLSVDKLYRGNDYCGLLLLNVMYYFDQKRELNRKMVFRIAAYQDNLPAIRAYHKIFGEPCYRHSSLKLVYFSTDN